MQLLYFSAPIFLFFDCAWRIGKEGERRRGGRIAFAPQRVHEVMTP